MNLYGIERCCCDGTDGTGGTGECRSVFQDVFDRADNTDLGGDWDEISGDWVIGDGNELGAYLITTDQNAFTLHNKSYAATDERFGISCKFRANFTLDDWGNVLSYTNFKIIFRYIDSDNYFFCEVKQEHIPYDMFNLANGPPCTTGGPGWYLCHVASLKLYQKSGGVETLLSSQEDITTAWSGQSAESGSTTVIVCCVGDSIVCYWPPAGTVMYNFNSIGTEDANLKFGFQSTDTTSITKKVEIDYFNLLTYQSSNALFGDFDTIFENPLDPLFPERYRLSICGLYCGEGCFGYCDHDYPYVAELQINIPTLLSVFIPGRGEVIVPAGVYVFQQEKHYPRGQLGEYSLLKACYWENATMYISDMIVMRLSPSINRKWILEIEQFGIYTNAMITYLSDAYSSCKIDDNITLTVSSNAGPFPWNIYPNTITLSKV